MARCLRIIGSSGRRKKHLSNCCLSSPLQFSLLTCVNVRRGWTIPDVKQRKNKDVPVLSGCFHRLHLNRYKAGRRTVDRINPLELRSHTWWDASQRSHSVFHICSTWPFVSICLTNEPISLSAVHCAWCHCNQSSALRPTDCTFSFFFTFFPFFHSYTHTHTQTFTNASKKKINKINDHYFLPVINYFYYFVLEQVISNVVKMQNIEDNIPQTHLRQVFVLWHR